MRDVTQEPLDGSEIAIIGMACRFPGANDVSSFWRNLRDGVESIGFFSAEELQAAGVDSALLSDPNYVRAAAILDDIEHFDAGFFGYTPREAAFMDPQQRLFLECAWTALEDAGYDPARYPGAIGVYAGAKTSTYLFNLFANPEVLRSFDLTEIGLGNDLANLSTRVSYKFNLRGPSYALHTACSTSLVAVHLACQSLLIDECQIALAGGVAVNVPHKAGYLYQHGGILSPDGHCRAFDAEAQGTIFGNGVGVVVLKRLEDALADGDTVHAIIRGSASNNDGAAKASFTAPGVEGQAEVIAEALANAGVRPETISYIEAHGTGTTLGDSIEVRALTRAFRTSTTQQGFCAIGSVKSNIGHLDTAAGISSLIKTVLALKHGQIPPSLHYTRPNPALDVADSPFYVADRLLDWHANGGPRRAGVSSFGFGSTNAHVILEEAPPLAPAASGKPYQLLILSARSATALEALSANLAAHLAAHPDLDLADVAYTLQVGRHEFDHRRALVCRSRDEALTALSGAAPERVMNATQPNRDRPLVFLFSGQGGQYLGMGQDLYRDEPTFRHWVDRCAELLRPHLGLDLRAVLYPDLPDWRDARDALPSNPPATLDQTWLTQPTLFVVEYALAQLWMSWGLRPSALIGHSIGEYVAACLAGVFALEDALALVAARGKLMQDLPAGAMLAVTLPEAELRPLLSPGLDLAAVNGPQQCVVAGPEAAIAAFHEELSARDVECRRLSTSHAFHSAMMDPILAAFTARVAAVPRYVPQIPMISNVSGSWLSGEDVLDPSYWARHLRQPVLFAAGVRELLRVPERILLEVGPGRALSSFVRQQLDSAAPTTVLASLRHLRKGEPDTVFLLGVLGKLWLAGATVDWQAFAAGQSRRRVPLPTYPFERQRYWIDAQPQALAQLDQRKRTQKQPAVADWFYLPAWRATALPTLLQAGASAVPAQSWLIFADEAGIGAALSRQFQQRDQPVMIVQRGERFNRVDDNIYTIDPAQPSDYATLCAELRSINYTPQVIVHLWSARRDEATPLTAADIAGAQLHGSYSLLYLARALGEHYAQEAIRIDVVTSGLHDATGSDTLRPEKVPLLGLCRVIPQEYANIVCRNIDIVLPTAGSWQEQRLLDLLAAELSETPRDVVVAYRGNRRLVQVYEPIQVPSSAEPPLRPNGVYLITGGLGEIGLFIAAELAATLQAKLVLTGRSAFPERASWDEWLAMHDEQDATSVKIRKLQACEAQGAELLLLRADSADLPQMQAAIAAIEARFGALHGVFHAAGLVGEQSFTAIQETGPRECEQHFQPKVYGLLVLEQVLRGKPLDFCLLFSSLSTILGGFWSAAYAGANLFMDAFARQHNQHDPVPWISVNWDAWQLAPARGQNIITGATLADLVILPDEGRTALRHALRLLPLDQVVVSTGDLQARIDQWVRLEARQEQRNTAADPSSRHARPNLATDYVAPRNEIEQQVAEIWQQVLGIEPIGVNDDFFELGGHSLLITQVLNKLHKIYPVEIAMRSLFEKPSVAGLAGLVAERYQNQAGAPVQAIADQVRAAEPAQRLELLEGYLRRKVAEALALTPDQIPPDGDLSAFNLAAISGDVQWFCQQDFRLQIYPHEVPRLQSLGAMARFLNAELERLAQLQQITRTEAVTLYDQYEQRVVRRLETSRATFQLARKNPPMFFVLASPRSGSTLFRVMLAGHPALFAPPELGILWYDTMRDWHRSLTDPDYGHGFYWAAQGLQWTFTQLMERDGEATKAYMDTLIAAETPIHAVYARLQQLASPRILVDKSPSYGMSLATLERAEEIFAGAKYVHLVRHPYAMIESFVRIRLDKLFGTVIYGSESADPHVVAEKVWVTCNSNVRAFLQQVDPQRHYLLRYEDLVGDSERAMRDLCAFLELPFDPAVLQPYDDRRERMITGIGDPNILQHDKVDARLGEVWKRIRLPRRLAQPAQRLAAEFGYALPVEAAPPSADEPGDLLAEADPVALAAMVDQVSQLSPEEVQRLIKELQG